MSHSPTSIASALRIYKEPSLLTRSQLADALFPLPLTPFEAMAHFDSWPDYPMSCGAVFRFRGRINRSAFDEAVAAANLRHPLIEAHVLPDANGRLYWQPSDQRCLVEWLGERDATKFNSSVPFDLQQETGVRLWVQQRDDYTNVFAEFHHSCCDGAGGLSYMEDIFACYANLLKDGKCSVAELPPNNPLRLLERGKFHKTDRPWQDRLRSLATDFRATSKCLLRQPVKLARSTSGPQLAAWGSPSTRFVTRVFSRESCTKMRKTAAAAGATLNDYLLNALTVVIRDSLADQDADTMKILVPVNLRGRNDLQMGLTNRMSYAFVERPTNAPAMNTASLKAIAAQSLLARQAQLPIRLLEKLALVQAMGLWSLIFSPNRCLATAAFSNLGDPSRRFRTRFPRKDRLIQVGNLLMHQFEGTTALRPNTRAGLFVNTYGNQLNISVRLDPSHFTRHDAEEFLERFALRIDAAPKRRIAA